MENKKIIDSITTLAFGPESGPLLKKYDCALVLGNDWINTMDHVFSCYQKQLFDIIIITGHSKFREKMPEAKRFYNYGTELGIPKEIMYLELEATNTKENMINVQRLLDTHDELKGIKSILIFCLAFHSGRVIMTSNQHMCKDFYVSIYGVVDDRNIRDTDWWETDVGRIRVMQEVERIGKYFTKGDISF